ncbi:HNH endonuclease [Rhodobacter capsulatus]|uniref:HNH endonuclease n=1 Tax=Rhodobacter capsulatus TaxID=1061 RepID=UPI00402920EA
MHELFSYDPETGVLRWKISTTRSVKVGDVAGCIGNKGYVSVSVSATSFKAHRLIWVMHHGDIPPDMQIDHINGNRSDNRIANLRLVSCKENGCNKLRNKNGVSGLKGVSWNSESGKWMAKICANGKTHYLGRFDCKAAAHFAYLVAADKLHGEFALHNSRN